MAVVGLFSTANLAQASVIGCGSDELTACSLICCDPPDFTNCYYTPAPSDDQKCYYDCPVLDCSQVICPVGQIPYCDSSGFTEQYCGVSDFDGQEQYCTVGGVCECGEITGYECQPDGSCAYTMTGDINVSMLPDSRTIYQGDNTNFGVTISSVNNFSGNVNLTLSGCPPGATCSLPSSTFVPAGSYSTVGLTITNTSSAPTGGFALTVTGTSGSISDSDTSWLNINPPPNSSPSVTSVDITEPDYCITGPSITVNWNYSDPEGDPQTYYQVQVDDIGSAWNLPLAYDSGKTAGSTNSIYATGLDFNVTYKARVKVWDSNNNESSWTESSSWKTPIHPYPDIQFNPPPPEDQTVKVEIPFDDQTVFCEDFTPPSTCFPSNANKTWVWDWDDSTQKSSSRR